MIYEFIAAFGGGVFGAAIGGLPAFIMTGVVATIGAMINMGGGADVAVNTIAFGSFFGPHVAFTGGVCAAAYARKKGVLENGADIATALAGLNDPSVLLIGGIFGVIGCAVKTLFGLFMGGTVSTKLVTDLPGITVFVVGIIARLIFGERGLMSDVPDRKAFSSGAAMGNTLLIGFGYALVVSCVYVILAEAGDVAMLGSYHVLIFGLAAVGLVFAEMGTAYFGWHHIGIISAEAVMAAYAAGMGAAAIAIGVVFGLLAALIGDLEGNLWNTNVDSHIDPPATAIFILTIVINVIFG